MEAGVTARPTPAAETCAECGHPQARHTAGGCNVWLEATGEHTQGYCACVRFPAWLGNLCIALAEVARCAARLPALTREEGRRRVHGEIAATIECEGLRLTEGHGDDGYTPWIALAHNTDVPMARRGRVAFERWTMLQARHRWPLEWTGVCNGGVILRWCDDEPEGGG